MNVLLKCYNVHKLAEKQGIVEDYYQNQGAVAAECWTLFWNWNIDDMSKLWHDIKVSMNFGFPNSKTNKFAFATFFFS